MRRPLIYFTLGSIFTYFAFISIDETLWNMTTILLLLLATLDFTIGMRYLRHYFIQKRNRSDKRD